MTIKAILHRLVIQPIDLEVYDEVDKKLKELGFAKAITEESKYHKTQIDQGYVLDIGATAFRDYVQKYGLDIPVKIGDLVTYARHSGKHLKDGESEVVVINDDDVIAVHQE